MIYLDTSPYRRKQAILGGQTLEEIYFQKVNDYLKNQRDEIIATCESKLKFNFSSSNTEEKLRELILCQPEVMKNFIDNLDVETKQALDKLGKNLPDSFKRLKKYNEGVLRKEEVVEGQKRRINNLMVSILGITVCPYCNRNFINNRDDKLGAQMDHFYSKDSYPIFAVSLYNFVPVCGVCNNIKRTHCFKINPFIKEDAEKHEVHFSYNHEKIDEFNVVLSSSEERRSDYQAINLEEAYAIHSIDIQNMLDREERYSQSYRDELRKIFKVNGLGGSEFQLSLTDDEIDRMIYGDTVFEEDIRNIPLGKFRRDIYQEIKKLRKD